jgi:hypothetical protein
MDDIQVVDTKVIDSPFVEMDETELEEFGMDSEMRDLVEDFKLFENMYGVDTHMVIEQLHDNSWYAEFKDQKKAFDNYNEVREFFINQQ